MKPTAPRIFYFCYRHNQPRGGQKHTYRHVDILNRNGIEAYAFHPGEEFRLTWFANETKVITESEFRRRLNPARDIIVLPEDMGTRIVDFPGRKVIFNKNIFTGFQAFGWDADGFFDPYLSSEVLGAFVVSEHNRKHLQLAYPQLLVQKVDVEIDPAIFCYRPLKSKAPLIACSLKAPEVILPLYHILRARAKSGLNCGKAFEWVFLDGLVEQDLARVLSDAVLFVTLSVAEGIGRLSLEAMASGCLLISCKAGPLADIVVVAESFRYGEMSEMVRFIERVMAAFPDELEQWSTLSEQGKQAADFFSPDQQEAGVIRAWEVLLSQDKAGSI